MVTDLFMIETNAKLAASNNYHETALELGLVRHHMQGYRDGSYASQLNLSALSGASDTSLENLS